MTCSWGRERSGRPINMRYYNGTWNAFPTSSTSSVGRHLSLLSLYFVFVELDIITVSLKQTVDDVPKTVRLYNPPRKVTHVPSCQVGPLTAPVLPIFQFQFPSPPSSLLAPCVDPLLAVYPQNPNRAPPPPLSTACFPGAKITHPPSPPTTLTLPSVSSPPSRLVSASLFLLLPPLPQEGRRALDLFTIPFFIFVPHVLSLN